VSQSESMQDTQKVVEEVVDTFQQVYMSAEQLREMLTSWQEAYSISMWNKYTTIAILKL